MTDDATVLKPCPFCGGQADIFTPTFPMAADCDDIFVRCEQCDAMGPQVLFDQDAHDADDLPPLMAEAIEGWNTRAAIAAGVDGWRPIETAPKDGSPMRLYDPEHDDEEMGRSWDGHWADCRDDGSPGWVAAVWDNCQDYFATISVNPTHWQRHPAPPPPEGEQGK